MKVKGYKYFRIKHRGYYTMHRIWEKEEYRLKNNRHIFIETIFDKNNKIKRRLVEGLRIDGEDLFNIRVTDYYDKKYEFWIEKIFYNRENIKRALIVYSNRRNNSISIYLKDNKIEIAKQTFKLPEEQKKAFKLIQEKFPEAETIIKFIKREMKKNDIL